jgi:CRP/FNR family cyclic AMP-dependent transcriptional regulator
VGFPEREIDRVVSANVTISQHDLAAMAGIARKNVSRTLSEWREKKIVSQVAHYYRLHNVAALERELQAEQT